MMMLRATVLSLILAVPASAQTTWVCTIDKVLQYSFTDTSASTSETIVPRPAESWGLAEMSMATLYAGDKPREFTVSRVTGQVHGAWFGTESADSVWVVNPVQNFHGWSFHARAIRRNDEREVVASQALQVYTWVEGPDKPLIIKATGSVFDVALGRCRGV